MGSLTKKKYPPLPSEKNSESFLFDLSSKS